MRRTPQRDAGGCADCGVRPPMVVLVLRIPGGNVRIVECHAEPREHASSRPEALLTIGGERARQPVHRPLGEFHPPDCVSGLILRAAHAVSVSVLLHFAERASVRLRSQRRRWWRPELLRVSDDEGLCESESRVGDEAIPGRSSLSRAAAEVAAETMAHNQ
jgi:hypothetical protein